MPDPVYIQLMEIIYTCIKQKYITILFYKRNGVAKLINISKENNKFNLKILKRIKIILFLRNQVIL